MDVVGDLGFSWGVDGFNNIRGNKPVVFNADTLAVFSGCDQFNRVAA